MTAIEPCYLNAGETALVVEFGSTIDEAVNERVLALDAALASDLPEGVIELVPTYRSLMIHYDPITLSRENLVKAIQIVLDISIFTDRSKRLWTFPACYDEEFAEDLAHVAKTTGLNETDVVDRHAKARYRVFMYGFSPGWAYLGGLPKELALPRRMSPRAQIPPGSLIIAGGQAIVASLAMPSGWHILGRTPERLFAPERNPVFLVSVGDLLTFDAVDRTTFDALQQRAQAGELVARREALR